jgi:cytochrome o ubiquinol oxidase subunit 1
MLLLDRYLGFHFFSVDAGGNAMMYVNLFWVWGHPEVYILVLPAFGIYSEVSATFSGKPLFGYRSMVAASMAICVLSYMVWLHHFFTMGASANVNAFFGVASMVIAVPTGVKIFNWLFTMYGGRVRFETPVLWTIGFMVTFVLGGLTGVLLAVPPVDWQMHNSVFLIAHFHHVIIPGVVFGVFAGIIYWFPKAFGFKLDERWGQRAFWCWFIGFHVAFMPLYALGLAGMTRRLQHYDVAAWQPWLIVAAIGVVIICAGVVCQIVQLVVSIRGRAELRDVTGDPWNGRTLEWSTASPPPAWNYAVLPRVAGRDTYWTGKQRARTTQAQPAQSRAYEPIEMPKNSPIGFVNAFFAVVTGFALIWHIWWMAGLGLVGAFLTLIAFAFRDQEEVEIPAAQVAQFDARHQAEVTP